MRGQESVRSRVKKQMKSAIQRLCLAELFMLLVSVFVHIEFEVADMLSKVVLAKDNHDKQLEHKEHSGHQEQRLQNIDGGVRVVHVQTSIHY